MISNPASWWAFIDYIILVMALIMLLIAVDMGFGPIGYML